jgi:hypothetical protein
VRVRVTGAANVRANLARAVANAHRGMAAGVAKGAERILAESQAVVPVKSGALKASGAVSPVETTSTTARAAAYYDTPYAADRHEDLTKPNSKFLEQPAMASGPAVKATVAANVKAAVGV